jgi:hypothetical protein
MMQERGDINTPQQELLRLSRPGAAQAEIYESDSYYQAEKGSGIQSPHEKMQSIYPEQQTEFGPRFSDQGVGQRHMENNEQRPVHDQGQADPEADWQLFHEASKERPGQGSAPGMLNFYWLF